MPRLSELNTDDIRRALASGQFRLTIGTLRLRIDSRLPEFLPALQRLYSDYPCSVNGGDFDFDVSVDAPNLFRRWLRRNATFRISGDEPFLPMATDHAHALFEWGTNWVIGAHLHNYLIIHSAVLERHGKGVMFVAVSGGGKSTLAADLSLSGWRLLSDEMALIDRQPLRLIPHPRPVSLKNASIDIICQRHPQATMGPPAIDTHKGTIVHLRAPVDSVERGKESAEPAMIVFPKWTAGASPEFRPVGPGDAALRLIGQSFNYPMLGAEGFDRLATLVETAPAWEIEYDSLDDAGRLLDELLTEDA